MASDHEKEGDVVVLANETAPQQVCYHDVVFVLPPTVVHMEMDIAFPQPMYFEEVVEPANNRISSLPTVHCLIN